MLIRHRPDPLLECSERSDRRDCQRDVGMDMRICLKLLSFVSSLETSVVSFVLSVFSMFCSISELDVCAKELVCRSQVNNSIVVSSCVRLRRLAARPPAASVRSCHAACHLLASGSMNAQ
jgi:hypothetical protein